MYEKIVIPVLDHLDSESMHDLAREALHVAESSSFSLKVLEALILHREKISDSRLTTQVEGITFDNPILVGAGWDKIGHSVLALYTLGFAGVEIGSVTPLPQQGNEKPRQFVIGNGVALQHLGLPSPGMVTVAQNLEKYRKTGIPIGINIGKNKHTTIGQTPEDYAQVVTLLYSLGHYFVINVSSPNTPGLRDFQNPEKLKDIIKAMQEAMDQKGERKPLFIKISPDLSFEEIDAILHLILDMGVSGIIAVNTTINDHIRHQYDKRWHTLPGGISGNDPEYKKIATDIVRHIYRQTQGKITIIGIGGITSTTDAIERMQAGADLIQLVTAIRTKGPSVANDLNKGILAFMTSQGIQHISELIGNES